MKWVKYVSGLLAGALIIGVIGLMLNLSDTACGSIGTGFILFYTFWAIDKWGLM